jgi:two-component system, NarL family, nitrate/nitrite response regulator NarL
LAALQILIVDDNPHVRFGIRRLLQSHADWVICAEAANGIEAVREAEEHKPDVILLDISMPRMDGLTALPLIREKSPASQIIVLTLHESLDTARAASREGANAYIAKSLINDLLSALEGLQSNETPS